MLPATARAAGCASRQAAARVAWLQLPCEENKLPPRPPGCSLVEEVTEDWHQEDVAFPLVGAAAVIFFWR